MRTKKNILFSTTRQWNPGDEFILKGILAVINSISDDFNPIIFNRNPEIKHEEANKCFNFQFNMDRFRFKILKSGFYDNSFKKELFNEKFIDLAIFAGTPEWASSRMRVFYQYINQYSIPAIYLGIGLGECNFDVHKLSDIYKDVIKNAKLIIVRDWLAKDALSMYDPIFLPCPSLLAAPKELERNISKVKRVGLIYGTDKSVKSNRIDSKTYSFILNAYKKILAVYGNQFDFEFICHYVNELPEFLKDFPKWDCNYSYDSADYIGIYNKFDLVVGPRIHGVGISASMGIPGINIRHDMRGDTCFGFDADVVDLSCKLDDFLAIFDSKIREINSINCKLLKKKYEIFREYRNKLIPILQEV